MNANIMSAWERELTTVTVGVIANSSYYIHTAPVKKLLAENKDFYLAVQGKSCPSLKHLSHLTNFYFRSQSLLPWLNGRLLF